MAMFKRAMTIGLIAVASFSGIGNGNELAMELAEARLVGRKAKKYWEVEKKYWEASDGRLQTVS